MTTCSAGFVGRRARFVSALRSLTVAALVLLHWAPAAATSPFDAPLERFSRNSPATEAGMKAGFERGWSSPDPATRLAAARALAVNSMLGSAGMDTMRPHVAAAVSLASELRDDAMKSAMLVIQLYEATDAPSSPDRQGRMQALFVEAITQARQTTDPTARCLVTYALAKEVASSLGRSKPMELLLDALAVPGAAPTCRSWVVSHIARLNGHGVAPNRMELFEPALAQVDEALAATPPDQYPSIGGLLLVGRGMTLERAGKAAEAVQPMQMALSTGRRIKDPTPVKLALGGLYFVYSTLERHRDALNVLSQAREYVNPDMPMDSIAIDLWTAMANSKLVPPDGPAALAALERARKLVEERSVDQGTRELYRTAAEVQERLGNYAAALDQTKRLMQLNSTEAVKGDRKALADLQVKFDVEKRKLEAERLQDSVNALTERRNLLMGGLALAAVAALALGWLLRNQVRQKRHVASLYGQLENLNQKRAQFLASAYHDLRQPAHSLSLLAEVAATAPAASPRVMDDIRRLTVLMSDMLTSLLDMNQLERGEMNVTPGPVSLDALFDEAARQFQPDAQRKRLSLTVQPGGLWVRSDPQVLRRIVFNLVSNACKYTDRGSVRLTATQRDGDRVEIEVSDTGRGMPPERVPDMLRPYTRMDHGTSETGLGIGLSVVQRATALLGHTLGIDSAPGQGTRVRITLAASEPVLADTVAPQPADTLDGAVVAVIDDSAEVRAALQLLLEQWNAQVVQAASSADVARSLAEGAFGPGGMPDLLVVDHDMGDETGFDAIERLRARQGWEQMPAVMVTGSVSPDIEQRSRALGVPLLLKPARPAQMRRVLHALLSRRREAADAMAA